MTNERLGYHKNVQNAFGEFSQVHLNTLILHEKECKQNTANTNKRLLSVWLWIDSLDKKQNPVTRSSLLTLHSFYMQLEVPECND